VGKGRDSQAYASTVRVYSRVSSSVGIVSPLSVRSSRYTSIASFAIAIASSIVPPKVTQPGKGWFYNCMPAFRLFPEEDTVLQRFHSVPCKSTTTR